MGRVKLLLQLKLYAVHIHVHVRAAYHSKAYQSMHKLLVDVTPLQTIGYARQLAKHYILKLVRRYNMSMMPHILLDGFVLNYHLHDALYIYYINSPM